MRRGYGIRARSPSSIHCRPHRSDADTALAAASMPGYQKDMNQTSVASFSRALVLATSLLAACGRGPSYDLVIANGRVIDPESGLDSVRHVGIRGGRIEAVSASPLNGTRVIDATGHVVAPGFIDLH
jgi:hypothetical protein